MDPFRIVKTPLAYDYPLLVKHLLLNRMGIDDNREIVFAEPYEYDEDLEEVYRQLHAESGISLRQHTGR